MHKIIGDNLKILIPLLKADTLDYPMALGVLDGQFSGYAFVNNPENPDKAIVFHSHGGFMYYLGNEPNQAESEDIGKLALSYRSDRSYCNWVEFAHCPISVYEIIKKKHPKADAYSRLSWHNDPKHFSNSPKPSIPDGCITTQIKKEHFSNTSLKLETKLFWESTDNFLEKTFGVVALDSDKKIIGVCSSVSNSDNFYEINIEVNKSNRRQGIGYAVAYHFIQECFKRGKKPHWDCLERNKPSKKLAKKLGFFEVGKYPLVYWTYEHKKNAKTS